MTIGLGDFSPGIDSMRAAGISVTRAPYASGPGGIRASLETMAQKIREGRVDAAVMGWARKVLKDKGLDGRDRPTVRQQAGALLDELRASTIYAPDPYGVEMISSASATLCLRPGLCIGGGDCDDMSIALGSATMSLGIPTMIVKQNFGADQQEHVLIAVQDEAGEWLYADPSTRMPLGSALHAKSEVWVDPMDPIGTLPEATAELVTLGAVPRQIQRVDGVWWEHHRGEWLRHNGHEWQAGLGSPPGLGATVAFQSVPGKNITKGLRYRVGFLINVIAQPGDTPPATADIKTYLMTKFANDWLLEAVDPTVGVSGGVQSWILQGIALNNQTLVDDPPNAMWAVSYQAVGVQASAPAVTPDAPIVAAPATPPTSGVSVGAVVAGAVAVAAVGGIAWGLHNRKRKGRR